MKGGGENTRGTGERRKGGHLPRRWLFDPFNLCGLPTGSGYNWLRGDTVHCPVYAAGRAGVAASSDGDVDVGDSIIHNTKGDYTNGDWLCALRVEPASYLTVAQLCLTVDHQPSLSSLETTVTKLRRCPAPAAVRLRRAQIFFGYFEANYL